MNPRQSNIPRRASAWASACVMLCASAVAQQNGVESAYEIHEEVHAMAANSDVGSSRFELRLEALRLALEANPDQALQNAYEVHYADHINASAQHVEAEQVIRQVRDRLQPGVDDDHRGIATRVLAESHLTQGEPEEAIKLLLAGIAERPQTETYDHIRFALEMSISEARLAVSDYSGALMGLMDVYPVEAPPEYPMAPAHLDYQIGKTHERMGELPSAKLFYESAIDRLDRMDPMPSPQGYAIVNLRLGNVQLKSDAVSEARERFEGVLKFATEYGLGNELTYARFQLAIADLQAGNLDAALRNAQLAHDTLTDANQRLILGRTALLLGQIHMARSDYPNALSNFQEAVAIQRELGGGEGLAAALEQTSGALRESGRSDDAWEALQQAHQELKQAFQTRDEKQTSRLRAIFTAESTEVRNELLQSENEVKALQLEKQAARVYSQTIVLVTLTALLTMAGMMLWRQKRYQRKLEELADTDALTGLLNHRRIHEAGDRLTARAWHDSEPLSVIVADVDKFKSVNDTYGHDVGDRVIQRVAAALSAGLREGDRAGRLGGEEFLLVLPGSREEGATLVAERIRNSIAAGDGSELGEPVRVTVSFGVAELDPAHGRFAELVKTADERLYRAKSEGRNRVVSGSGPYLSSVE